MHSKAFAESEDPKKWIGLGNYVQLLTKINCGDVTIQRKRVWARGSKLWDSD